MPKCVYCGKMYDTHKGLTLVGNDGTINYFCSSKCRKSKAMKRRKVRWISKAKVSIKEREAEVKAESQEVEAAAEASAEVAKEAEKEAAAMEEKEEEKKEEPKEEPKKEEKPAEKEK